MVHIKPTLSSLLILLFLFSPITTASAAAFSFPFPGSCSQYKTFISHAHSLFSRVSNQRAAFGDIAGTKLIAQSLERGLYVYDSVLELNQLTFISLTPSLFSRVSNLLAERGDIAGANRTKLFARSLERVLYVYDAVSGLNQLTFISLSPSLFSRVSNLRAERGDIAGANRTKLFARSLERVLYVCDTVSGINQLLGFLSNFGRTGSKIESTTWVARNYRNVLKVATSVSELNQQLGFLSDFGRAGSEIEMTTWVARNYRNVLSHSWQGVLKEVVETVQREVREGDLLRDCLEVGSGDLQGLVQIIKDVASQYYPTLLKYKAKYVLVFKDVASTKWDNMYHLSSYSKNTVKSIKLNMY